MILLKCKICDGEVNIIGNDNNINKKTKCLKCGHTSGEPEQKGPEVIIMRKRSQINE